MIWIGIDCGAHTGFAVWDSLRRELLCVETLPLHKALKRVEEYKIICEQRQEELRVVFEDARQRKWLPREMSDSEYRGKLMGAGSVKRDAVIWEEFLKDSGISYIAQAPTKGATKLSSDTFANITDWKGRTSNHARDAAMMVFGR